MIQIFVIRFFPELLWFTAFPSSANRDACMSLAVAFSLSSFSQFQHLTFNTSFYDDGLQYFLMLNEWILLF